LRAVDPDSGERPIKYLASGADEGLAPQVLLIARLFADEHDLRIRRPLAEHRLRRALADVAAAAMLDRLAKRRQRDRLRQISGRPFQRAAVPLDHLLRSPRRLGKQFGDEL